ncbi:MAG: putative lipid II flippase FtsW [Synergistaceae bacterium]|jgi:cell division protein FtsW|nr:putative lipid II flippase FtsW [Synergistaceae bacterium]
MRLLEGARAESKMEEIGPAPRIDPLVWMVPLVLSSIGILMVTSTTSPESFDMTGTPFTTGIKQLKWLFIGLCAMLFIFKVPMRVWYRFGGALWCMSFIMVILTLIPGLGSSAGGAKRWLRVFGVSIQPSEIMTLAVVFVIARLAVKNEMNPVRCFSGVLILTMASCLPLMLQPDLGSTILTVLICMGMYVERFGWKLPLLTGAMGLMALPPFIIYEPYRLRRFLAWFNPWHDPSDTGFQPIQGLIAFANGRGWGSGLGHGFQKLNYLPAAETDYIYAALGEELGLMGTLGVLLLCTLWIIRCRILYNRVSEGFATSIVWGVTITVVLPMFINIAGVTNLMPLTGMPLPFLSYGGSSLVMMWVRIGVMLRMHKEYYEAL